MPISTKPVQSKPSQSEEAKNHKPINQTKNPAKPISNAINIFWIIIRPCNNQRLYTFIITQ